MEKLLLYVSLQALPAIFLISTTGLFFSSQAPAAPGVPQAQIPKKVEDKTPEVPLYREKALRENQISESDRNQATDRKKDILRVDTDLQGILRLDNPYRDPRVASTRNSFAISFRPFKPSGFAEVEGSQKFSFNELREFIVPTLEYSFLSRRSPDSTNFDYGVKGSFGYYSQARRLRLSANQEEADTTFGVGIIEIGPVIQVRPISWGSWQWNTMAVFGVTQHHQNSSTSFARFSVNQSFWGINAGPGFYVAQSWFLEANYKFAQILGRPGAGYSLQIPESSYSVGLSRQW